MRSPRNTFIAFLLTAALAGVLSSCGTAEKVQAGAPASGASPEVSVGIVKASRQSLQQQLTLSSELVPFQEIDIYAKEAGYVKQLNVDYGSRVKAGQVLATLEIPELQLQLQQDDAAVKRAQDQITHARHELKRVEAQHRALHLQYTRLDGVARSKPGLVAQQEIDDAQGKDLAAEAQTDASKSNLEAAESQLAEAQAKRLRDQILFDYSRITAPFAGVITQRYANLGTLMQAGTSSSTQAMPLVRLSEDSLFRLVIPVPESYVRFVHVGDPVNVVVSSLNRTFPGKIARFSVDVREDTRTMRTEVDVPNQNGALMPGLYAEATLILDRRNGVLAVPLQAVNREGDRASIYLVAPSHKIEVRPVKLGIQTPSEAEVLSGLHEGEDVVVSDRSGLKPGQEVKSQQVEIDAAKTQGS
ncbi:MAG: efflux RND transporter periplasmic adaptor subunit [Bryobacterales bacterium]|nr:efflux RND transporter periplasmic adaptor subunit [Bryobacterales bacterium]